MAKRNQFWSQQEVRNEVLMNVSIIFEAKFDYFVFTCQTDEAKRQEEETRRKIEAKEEAERKRKEREVNFSFSTFFLTTKCVGFCPD